MAEELITPASAVVPLQGEADSQESGQPTGEKQEKRQPKQETVSLEDFRKFQATKDREVAQARQSAQLADQRMQQLEQQLHQLSIRDLPEDEQRIAHLDRLRQQAEQRALAAEQYAQQLASQQQVNAMLLRVSNKTGLPLEEAQKMFFEQGKSADDIWEAAAEYKADQRRNRRRPDDDPDDEDARADKAARNRTDPGEGRGKPATDFESRLRKAKESGSAVALARLMIQQEE